MRAVIVEEHGPPDVLSVQERPAPTPGAGEVLVEVAAAGVNFADLLVVGGRYQILPPRPFVPGKELAGTVAAVGAGAGGLKPGDRVLAEVEHGAWAEQATAPAASCFRLPDGMAFETAAAMGLAYQTAHFALVARGGLRQGETVLVTGAGGGVGLAAVQLAKTLGARVLAGVGSPRKAEPVRRAGADDLVDLAADGLRDALRAQVRAATGGGGADLVVETVGGDVFDASLRALAWCGRLVVVGFAGGRIPSVAANYLLVRNISVSGLQWSDYRERAPDQVARVQDELFELWRQGHLQPPVMQALPLERCAEALDLLRRRQVIGKLVLTTGGTAAG